MAKKAEKPNKYIEFYFKEYKKLFIIPLILLVFSITTFGFLYVTTGDFILRDVTLKGGISLTINTDHDTGDLQRYLESNYPQGSFNVRTLGTGIIVEASDIDQNILMKLIQDEVGTLGPDDFSVETMGSNLGTSFFRQMFTALLLAFLAMGIVFHIYFRNFYATGAAIVSVLFDILFTVGIMNVLGVRLTAGGIAAYLMLIGYSIDTSILLSTKLLKEAMEIREGIMQAAKTGLTMSAAGIAAMGVSFLLTNNGTLRQIMLILLVGLMMDVITTWISNVFFLRSYLERRKNA